MGAEVDRDRFSEEEYAAFGVRLRENLEVLRDVLARPGFGAGPPSIGAELEGSFVDADGTVSRVSADVQRDLADPRVVSELARFNVEANLAPQPLTGRALAAVEAELREVLESVDGAARSRGARLVVAGIVPSIEARDVGADAVTDEPRYRALENGLDRLRGRAITLAVDGPEPLALDVDSVAVEGASTSWQLHLRVPPQRFRQTYDAARLATVVALAACGNAPFLAGHRLWDETRIALFRQAVDARGGALPLFPRVGFGDGWLEPGTDGAYELFAGAVRQHPPIVPVTSDRPPAEDVVAGGAPALAELRMHTGTVWSWTRPVYDPVGGGHLRVELRALPSGPTATDVMAGTALLLGLTLAFEAEVDDLARRLPFASAHQGFLAAARRGLDAELAWPSERGDVRRLLGRDLVMDLLPAAQAGLDAAGLDRADTEPRLQVIADRVRTGRTGARWLAERAAVLEEQHDRRGALRALTLEYADRCGDGAPVHTWPTG